MLRNQLASPALRAAAEALPFVTPFRDRSASPDAPPGWLTLAIDPDLELEGSRRAESYRLDIEGGGVEIRAADEPGVFYALQTLAQLAERGGQASERRVKLAAISILDWPDFRCRALSLDVSRDKVPSMATLFDLVDRMASWKLNQLQLYMEHVFAYRGHEQVWENASAFTAEELRELDAYCRARFIELVPSQNSLAHFHRWLQHDRYRPLAESPEGILHPFSRRPEPFSLCPTDPRCLELIDELYGQLLPNFSSKLVHVGLDEPMDLGHGRSKTRCDREGKGRVFLEYLRSIRLLVEKHGSTMQFWTDWILNYPEAVADLPEDVIAMEWGYEADHPFEAHLELLSSAVSRHYVCPGTSSWNSIGGRTSNALANLLRAGRVGRGAGSEGYMITDWGDHGHWQPLPVSFAGYLMGAAVAWNTTDTPSPAELASILSSLAFRDEADVLGRVALALGDAHLAARTKTVNGSAPFFLLHFADQPLPHERLPDLSVGGLEACLVAIDDAMSPISSARTTQTQVIDELEWAADMMRIGCRLGIARLRAKDIRPLAMDSSERIYLSRELRALSERHRSIWLVRNRPGGLDASAGRIDDLAELIEADPAR